MSFHINAKGEPGSCSAKPGNCPFGADAPHYETAAEARAAFEASMSSPYSGAKAEKLKDLLSLPWDEKSARKDEIRHLYKSLTGLPISHDGYLYIGEEKDHYGRPEASHLLKIGNFKDRFSVLTEALDHENPGRTRRRLKSASGDDLNFEQAMELVTRVAAIRGVAVKSQERLIDSEA